MKKRTPRKPPAGPRNLAAKALSSKIFALKVVPPHNAKTYTRKLKHRDDAGEATLPAYRRRLAGLDEE